MRSISLCRILHSLQSAEALIPVAVDALGGMIDFNSIGHIIMTHVDKKSIPTLQKLLEKIETSEEPQIQIHLTVPGLQFLRGIMGKQTVHGV